MTTPTPALDQLTPIQRAAVQATAVQHLADPEALAAEWLPKLLIEPDEYDAQEDADEEAAVNAALTPTTALPVADPSTFTITFSTAPTPLEALP